MEWRSACLFFRCRARSAARRCAATVSLERGAATILRLDRRRQGDPVYVGSRGAVSTVSTTHRSTGARSAGWRERCDYDRRPSPDGTQILHLVATQGENGKSEMRMMRVPASGGAPQFILQSETLDNFQCASLPAKLCIFGVATAQENRFVAFDPVSGQQTPLGFAVQGAKYNWTLSPDGQTIALAQWRRPEFSGVNEGWRSRALTLESEQGVSSLDWAADRKSLWASSSTFTGTQALLNIDLRGRVHEVFQDPDKDVGWAIPSLDDVSRLEGATSIRV